MIKRRFLVLWKGLCLGAGKDGGSRDISKAHYDNDAQSTEVQSFG